MIDSQLLNIMAQTLRTSVNPRQTHMHAHISSAETHTSKNFMKAGLASLAILTASLAFKKLSM